MSFVSQHAPPAIRSVCIQKLDGFSLRLLASHRHDSVAPEENPDAPVREPDPEEPRNDLRASFLILPTLARS
jgi:hypothetical protein